jgi:recombination protein RecA
LDSLAAMTPQKFAEGEVTQAQEPGLQARLIKQFGTQMNGILDANNCAMVYLNHEGKEIKMGGGPPSFGPPKTTTPGGNGPKFFASVRLAFSQYGSYKGKVWDAVADEWVDGITGHDVTVKVVKNKVAAPFKEAKVRTRHGYGLDNFLSAWKILKLRGRAHQWGAWYGVTEEELLPVGEKFNKEGKWQKNSEDALLKYADTHPEWRQTMVDAALVELEKSKDKIAPTYTPSPEELEDATAEE